MANKKHENLSEEDKKLRMAEKNTILKVEHFAEGLVAEFFKVFTSGNHAIQAFNCFRSHEEEILLHSKELKNKDGSPSEAESQFKLNDHFKVSDYWLKELKSTDSNIVIDDISCLDCVIKKKDHFLIPIEVKSGYSDAYLTLNDILRKSFSENPLKINNRKLSGDLISILGSATDFPEGNWSNLNFSHPKLLTSRDDVPEKYSLEPWWILVIRNRKQLSCHANFKFNFEGAGLKYILTLQDIVAFLQDEKIGVLPTIKTLKNENLSPFEAKIVEDLRFWIDHYTISPK